MSQIKFLNTVHSTNSYLDEFVRSSENYFENLSTRISEFYSVYALEQNFGRGQQGNAWHSEVGKNILFSTIIYPNILPENQFELNKAVSLGVYDFVKSYINDDFLKIKWSNDIYYNDKKLAGILIENTIIGNKILYSIAGIGLNLNQIGFPDNLPNPISLNNITGKQYNLQESIENLLSSLKKHISMIDNSSSQLNIDYHNSLYRLNEIHKYIYNKKTIEAAIIGVNDKGFLKLKTIEEQEIECAFKEIRYII